MGETADAIRDDIERRREAMTEDVRELEDRAKSMVDWREQVAERPLAALGVAAAGGLILGVLTGGTSDESGRHNRRSGSSSHVPHQGASYPAFGSYSQEQGNGHNAQQQSSGVTGWLQGSQGPSSATDAGKHRAASKVDQIRGALMALAASKAEEFLREAVPGFSDEVDKVKRESDSEGHSTDRRANHNAVGDTTAQASAADQSQSRPSGRTG